MSTTSFNSFAKEYDKYMGDTGDYTHQNTIDPALFEALGSVENKTIYDIGCGNGYIARKIAKMGAKEVWASDISEELVEIAKTKYDLNGIKYFVTPGEDFSNIPDNHFDAIVMNMAIHYIKDLDDFFSKVNKALKGNGRFVFTTDHPLHSHSYSDISGENNAKEIVERFLNYRKEVAVEVNSLWDPSQKITLYLRPFGYYINLLAKHNLFTYSLIEPPTKRLSSYEENIPVESEIPYKFALGAVKTKTNLQK